MQKRFTLIYISLLFVLISYSTSQEYIDLTLDKELTGKIEKKEEFIYYKLELSKLDITKGNILQLKVSSEDEFTKFSDPDIYVGVDKIKKPTRTNKNWFSEKFGTDMTYCL